MIARHGEHERRTDLQRLFAAAHGIQTPGQLLKAAETALRLGKVVQMRLRRRKIRRTDRHNHDIGGDLSQKRIVLVRHARVCSVSRAGAQTTGLSIFSLKRVHFKPYGLSFR